MCLNPNNTLNLLNPLSASGAVTPLSNDTTISYCVPLALRKGTGYLAGRWVRERAGHSHWSLPNAVTLFCTVNRVICSYPHFRNLHFNNILCVYCNSSLHKLSTDVSTSLYGVANFRQPSRGHVVTIGVFAPHVGYSRSTGILANLFPFTHRYYWTVRYAIFQPRTAESPTTRI